MENTSTEPPPDTAMPETEQTESMPDLSWEIPRKRFLPYLNSGTSAASSTSLKSILRSSRTDPGSSSTTSLKSILRSSRGEFRPGAPYNPRHLANKLKRKRVQFVLQNPEEQLDKWSGKRLRPLSDLDRQEMFPGVSLRFLNWQKTRHNRRSDQYNRLDRASTEASILDMDGKSCMESCKASKTESVNEDRSATKQDDVINIDQPEFVTKWLEHASHMRDHSFFPGAPPPSSIWQATALSWAPQASMSPSSADSMASLSNTFNTMSLRWPQMRQD